MDKDLTPLGRLLEAARQAKRPKLSQNAVAKAAGTSSTTYRRVISGFSRFGGQDVPFDGSPETVARIAVALGVTPEQIDQVDRAEVAEEMRLLLESAKREQRVPIGQAVEHDTAMPVTPDPLAGLPDDPDERLAELARRMRERSRENERNERETQRINAENQRINAEQRRLAEEAARIAGETGRAAG